MKRLLRAMATAVVVVGIAQPCAATPIQIAFLATDLADTVSGEDLWQYEYFVSDFVFAQDQGFAISFDPALYASLESPPPPVNADWDPLTFQPDPVLLSDGLYDALALVSNPSLADPFAVSFVWLGGATQTPGPQPFIVYELDAAGSLTVLETGATVPLDHPIPEPGTLTLLALGAAGLARRLRLPLARRGA